jgi:hypothetical protein
MVRKRKSTNAETQPEVKKGKDDPSKEDELDLPVPEASTSEEKKQPKVRDPNLPSEVPDDVPTQEAEPQMDPSKQVTPDPVSVPNEALNAGTTLPTVITPNVNVQVRTPTGNADRTRVSVPHYEFIPVIKHGFTSVFDISVSPDGKTILLVAKEEWKVPKWDSPMSYYSNLATWYIQAISKLDGIIIDVDKSENDVTHFVRTPHTSAGMNLREMVKRLSPTDANSIRFEVERGKNQTDEYDSRIETVVAAGMPSIIQAQVKLSAHTFNYIVNDSRNLYDFIAQLDNNRAWLEAYSNLKLRDRFDVGKLLMPTQGYIEMLDTNQEFRAYILNVMRGTVIDHLKFKSAALNETFTKILMRLRVNTNRFSDLNMLAADIVSAKGENFLYSLVTCMTMSRVYQMRFEPNLEHFDMVTLIDCLMLKLIAPAKCLTYDSRLAINAYICRYLLANISGWNGARYPPERINDPSADYYSDLSNLAGVRTGLCDQIWKAAGPFMRLTQHGGGFAGAGLNPNYRVANNYKYLLSSVRIEAMYGRPHDFSSTSENYPQMDNWLMFINEMFNRPMRWRTDKYLFDGFMALVEEIGKTMNNLRTLAVSVSSVMNALSLSSLTAMRSDADGILSQTLSEAKPYNVRRDFQRKMGTGRSMSTTFPIVPTKIEVARGTTLSMVLSVMSAEIEFFPSMPDFVFEGFSIHNAIRNFTGNMAIVDRLVPHDYFPRSKRVRLAIDLMDPVAKGILEPSLIVAPEVYRYPVSGSEYLMGKLDIVSEALDQYMPLFGVTKRIYFNGPKNMSSKYDGFRRHHIAQVLHDTPIEHEEFIELITSNKLADITRKLLKDNRPMAFGVPVPLTMALEERIHNYQEPFDFQKGLVIKPFVQTFRFKDDKLDSLNNSYALIYDPAWSSPDVPFLIINASILRGFVTSVKTLRDVVFISNRDKLTFNQR